METIRRVKVLLLLFDVGMELSPGRYESR